MDIGDDGVYARYTRVDKKHISQEPFLYSVDNYLDPSGVPTHLPDLT